MLQCRYGVYHVGGAYHVAFLFSFKFRVTVSHQVTWRPHFNRGGQVCPLVLFWMRPVPWPWPCPSKDSVCTIEPHGPWGAAQGADAGSCHLPHNVAFVSQGGFRARADQCWGDSSQSLWERYCDSTKPPGAVASRLWARAFVMQMKGRFPARCPRLLTVL